jgi:hypothetical protein
VWYLITVGLKQTWFNVIRYPLHYKYMNQTSTHSAFCHRARRQPPRNLRRRAQPPRSPRRARIHRAIAPAVPSPRPQAAAPQSPPRAWPHHRALAALRASQSPPRARAQPPIAPAVRKSDAPSKLRASNAPYPPQLRSPQNPLLRAPTWKALSLYPMRRPPPEP